MSPEFDENSLVDGGAFQAVEFYDDRVLYGHLQVVGPIYVLSQVYYYVRSEPPTLHYMGEDGLHDSDTRYIDRDQARSWWNLSRDSNVARAIEQHRRPE